MKVYTKTGDNGTTSLYGGGRVTKSNIVLKTLGEIDELSTRIGILCSFMSIDNYEQELKYLKYNRKIQRTLQDINTHIATFDKEGKKLPELNESLVDDLETIIDELEYQNDKLTKFILPGVTCVDAYAQSCRTQTRKVEREIVVFNNTEKYSGKTEEILHFGDVPKIILKYINRLSDFFFVFARWLCKTRGNQDYII